MSILHYISTEISVHTSCMRYKWS